MSSTPPRDLEELNANLEEYERRANAIDFREPINEWNEITRRSSSPIVPEIDYLDISEEEIEKEREQIGKINPKLYYALLTGKLDYPDPSSDEEGSSGDVSPRRTPPGFPSSPRLGLLPRSLVQW